MEHFWPTLPFYVPGSQGMPLWWSISWWIFQIVVMAVVLFFVTRWALKVDRLISRVPEKARVTVDDSTQSLDT